MKFETVQLEHVQRGVQDIKSKGLPIGFAHSLYFDVEVDGELHSPKALMAYANEHATGKAPKNNFKGGRNTPCFKAFERLGILIIPKSNSSQIGRFIGLYKQLISGTFESLPEDRVYNELYKWETVQWFQDNWVDNHSGSNILQNIERSFMNKNANNLWSGVHYLPYKALTDFAAERPETISAMLHELFDEERSLLDRIRDFEEKSSVVKDEVHPNNPDWDHYQSDRAMVLYLTLRYPDRYFFYKKRMFDDFCKVSKFWPPFGRGTRKEYKVIEDFLLMCEELKSVLKDDEELMALHHARLPESITFDDDDNMLVQDFMYSVGTYLNVSEEGGKESEQRLVAMLKMIGQADAEGLWEVIAEVLSDLEVSAGDERVCYSLPQDKGAIGLTIGQRYTAVIERQQSTSRYRYIDTSEDEQNWLKEADSIEGVRNKMGILKRSAHSELAKTTKSSYRADGSEAMEKTFFDAAYRELVFAQAFEKASQTASKAEIRTLFKRWLIDAQEFTSGAASSYLKAIEILESHFKISVYKEKDQQKLKKLYDDLIENQRKVPGKYHYTPASSYGEKGFFSASVDQFVQFLNRAQVNMPSSNLNQIFFGPPGTGKTYNTINEALKIVDPEFYAAQKDDRSALRARFQELQLNDDNEAKGQIGFATFHQSMSYEDFIEGIKPSPPEAGDEFLKYAIEDGIFKNMCRIAGDSLVTHPEKHSISLTAAQFKQAEFYKTSLGNTRDRDDDEVYEYCIENECISLGFGGGLDYSGKSEADIRKIGAQEGLGAYDVTAMNLFVNHLKEGSFVVVSNGNRYVRAIGKVTGPYEFKEQSPFPNNPHWNHFRQVDWSYAGKDIPSGELYNKNLSQMTIYKMDKREVNPAFFLKEKDDLAQKKSKNYVLIIDEINRGNVSAIFGELITLIEPNKRAGQREALSATLPYSKATFSVPSNLHIIGTMNTADRSVEALDSALRRRFSFKEMAPDSTIIADHGKLKATKGVIKPEGIDLPRMLDAINRRIELLRDKDYRIGHSYLMEVETVEDLKVAFKDKIIPLLEEYFFSDMGKLSLILGGKFIEPSEAQAESVFAGNHGYDEVLVNELLERRVYHIAPEEKWDFKSIYAS